MDEQQGNGPEAGFFEIALVKDFNVVVETLTRIGVAVHPTKTLYQTCHLLQKRGRYFIVHFKEMFLLNGKAVDLSEDDIRRRNAIIFLLRRWGLVEFVSDPAIIADRSPQVFVLPFADKKDWTLAPKYTFTKRRRDVPDADAPTV
jgi:hypothetical protein